MKQEVEIKIMPYLWYNQIQAYNFGLNHTQWIIMNYFSYWLPHFWESAVHGGKTYFWASISKPLSDMPTLSIKEGTLRENVRDLINKWILDRVILTVNGMSRAYYRVTDTWLLQSNFTYPSDFNTLYDIISSRVKSGEIKQWEVERLITLLSPTGKKEKNKTEYDLSWIENSSSPIIRLLYKELLLSSKGEWVKISVWKLIDEKYIKEEIVDHILYIGEKMWWLTLWQDWNPTQQVRNKIEVKLKTMFDWHKAKNKEINDFKLKINTFFGKENI